MINTTKDRIKLFIDNIEQMEIAQKANIKSKENLERSIQQLRDENSQLYKNLDVTANAITLIRGVSDEVVQKSYDFIADSINASLERIFNKTTRKIRIKEFTRAGQYPQLELELTVESGKIRSLKSDSGHGIVQIISLLCILSLIVITDGRRVLVLDEALSGLSGKSRKIISEILWSFTEIGFQFIISEHGYIPKGAKVYNLKMTAGISHIEREYIENMGVYLTEDLQDNDEYRGEVMGELKDGAVIQI